ncbi:ATP-dependent RNA helicase SUPV3L1, mitochondrial-like, partial [Planoprotostelium fungivorum]
MINCQRGCSVFLTQTFRTSFGSNLFVRRTLPRTPTPLYNGTSIAKPATYYNTLSRYLSSEVTQQSQPAESVRVSYQHETAQFRIYDGYTSNQLLRDVIRHFDLGKTRSREKKPFQLLDASGLIVPSSGQLTKIFARETEPQLTLRPMNNGGREEDVAADTPKSETSSTVDEVPHKEREVKRKKKKVMSVEQARAAEELAEVKIVTRAEPEEPKVTEEEEELSEEALRVRLMENLSGFVEDDWVREEIKNSIFYLETTHEIQSSFYEYRESLFNGDENILSVLYREKEVAALYRRILPFFLNFLASQVKYFDPDEVTQRTTTNMTEPHLWYVGARKMKRKFVLHVGPTNSGKTYSALERLATAKTGLYCGPLRLLASEVFEKLNAKGVPCNLVTGQQKIEVQDANHYACTVEMTD